MGLTPEERKIFPQEHTLLFVWLAIAAAIGVAAISVASYTYITEKNDVKGVACDNARAAYIQDEYLVYRTRQNLTHLSPEAIKEAISFYHALEDIIPVGRCSETRTSLRMEARDFIQKSKEK